MLCPICRILVCITFLMLNAFLKTSNYFEVNTRILACTKPDNSLLTRLIYKPPPTLFPKTYLLLNPPLGAF
uniref:Secreted protein n=1 Tax=Anguilla anguilla TaxID=7936 RepID=A0A0E9URB5_ANGAN